LRKAINPDALRKKAEILQDFAYKSPDKNRVIGTQGHQSTIDYIHDQIAKFPNYYTVELQPVPLLVGDTANFTANTQAIEVFPVALAPSGSVSGPLIRVPNLGCVEVSGHLVVEIEV